MKNLVWVVLGLAAFAILIFFFYSRREGQPDEIPKSSPIVGEQATESSMIVPFPILKKEEIDGKKIRIKTSKGDIVFELYADAPVASSNFIYLVGQNFYNNLAFHRREENFVIQGGDPKGNGTGGPGYFFADEPVNRDYERGIVAMANAGPDTNGSQFFIMLADALQLPKKYTIFGKVVKGMEVVDQIKVGDVMEKVTIE
jgi:cyclophilin family peptidyl-prolyl cis-trans isomerase